MKRTTIFCLALSFFLSGAQVVIPSVWAQDKTINLRYSTMFPPGHPHAVLSEQWCKEVEKRTKGRVKIRHYAGSTLTSPQMTYDSILEGVVDIGFCILGYTMGKFPLSEGLSNPLGFPSSAVATRLTNEYYAKFKPAEFNKVKVLNMQATGPGILHTKKPVNKMEDLKGMKIRTFGPTSAFISNLGAAPVAIPMGDAYDALSRGVVDGIYCPYEALAGYKLGEVVKYSIENFGSSYTGIHMVAMNKEKWNSLPADIQKTIDVVSQEWIEKMAKMWDDMDREGKQFTLKRGNKVITLTKEEDARWAKKAQPLIDDYIKNMKQKNLPGDEVVHFFQERLKTSRK